MHVATFALHQKFFDWFGKPFSIIRVLPLVFFYTPWKHQKTFGFLMFSRGYRKRSVAWNGLIQWSCFCNNFRLISKNESILCTLQVIEIAELVGLYVEPNVFCKLILPYIESITTSPPQTVSSALLILAAYIRGTNYKMLFDEDLQVQSLFL